MRDNLPIFDLLKSRFEIPVNKISFSVKSGWEKFEAENLVGKLDGSVDDSTIIICAHYDHNGGFADSLYFPGANDNASGVAALLNIATYFKHTTHKHKLVFIAFSGEEEGLIGSKYFAEHPLVPLDKTIFLLNFDMVASGKDGIMVEGGTNNPGFYKILSSINDSLSLGPLHARSTTANADQYYFFKKGVKTLFLYTYMGNQPYHSFQDIPETLDWKAFNNVLKLSKAFISAIDKR